MGASDRGQLDVTVRVAITITTHNRRDELARTLMHLGRLDPAPDEILVCADGCSDGTLELMKEQPSIRTIVHERAAGSIPSRNELGRACVSDVFVSLEPSNGVSK